MDLKERLEFCKKCQKRKFVDTGIICSLTENKPEFNNECSDFSIDAKEAQRMIAKSNYIEGDEENGSNKSIWVVLGVVLLVLRIILRFMRD